MPNKGWQVCIFMMFVCALSYVDAKRGIVQETELKIRYVATCQHTEMSLKCPKNHVIYILHANETRSPETKCLDTKLNSQECVTTYQFASRKCNMQQNCKQTLPDKVVGNRCPTNSKYFIVIFQCIEYPEISVNEYILCQAETGEISCAPGLISILNSFYGRKSRTTCVKEASIKHFFEDPTASDIMTRQCDGRGRCTVNATKEFGFVYKNGGIYPQHNYLQFTVRCFKKNLIQA